jgi:hypothetical protein
MIEVIKDLIECMESAIKAGDWKVDGACDPSLAIESGRQAIAELEKQEPVAWIDADILKKMDFDRNTYMAKVWSISLKDKKVFETDKPLYTSPQLRKPLTDKQAAEIAYKGFDDYWTENCDGALIEAFLASARAIEKAHGIGDKS